MSTAANQNFDHWFPTPKAVEILGMSALTLKRRRSIKEGGFLQEGKHWMYGHSAKAPIKWNVRLCLKEFQKRGKKVGEEISRQRELDLH